MFLTKVRYIYNFWGDYLEEHSYRNLSHRTQTRRTLRSSDSALTRVVTPKRSSIIVTHLAFNCDWCLTAAYRTAIVTALAISNDTSLTMFTLTNTIVPYVNLSFGDFMIVPSWRIVQIQFLYISIDSPSTH